MSCGTMGGRRRAAGFSLVELMITVVIVGILAAITLPSYNSQIRKSRRTEARTAVLDLAAREERFMAANNTYTAAPADLGYTSFGVPVNNGYYKLETPTNISGGTATDPATFTLTVTPVTGKGQDKDKDCAKFIVTQTGMRTAKNSGGTDNTDTCWK
jgi:type IV pilus assembly protein PilE